MVRNDEKKVNSGFLVHLLFKIQKLSPITLKQ